MKLKFIKAILLIAFIVLTVSLTLLGYKSSKATIDLKGLEKERSSRAIEESETEFNNLIKNIGNSTKLVKPDVLQSADTSRLSLSVRLLDTMKQYLYAGVLSEKLGALQNSAYRYHMAARYFLLATEAGKNQLMLFRRARVNLDKCLSLDAANNDAKVDLAVSLYNINSIQKPENQMDLMKPALLLREVVQSDSNHLDGLYFLGKLAIESNQLEKAVVRFKKLVSLQPQNREYYLELGGIYRMMGNETEAKAWESKARDIH